MRPALQRGKLDNLLLTAYEKVLDRLLPRDEMDLIDLPLVTAYSPSGGDIGEH